MRRLLLAAALLALVGSSCGGGDDGEDGSADRLYRAPQIEDPGPIHVHGLGVNPKDGALFIATHTGLFRAPPGEPTAERVADRYQDTMGFTVVGPDRFLGSGHPGGDDEGPPFLGLISSTDAGSSWDEVSLMGEVDFHVLEAAGDRVYGFGSDFETQAARFLVSDDGGKSWERKSTPESLISLAISPEDPGKIVAAGEDGVYGSASGGDQWRALGADAGLLAWADSLFRVDARGEVSASDDEGHSWRITGKVGGQPAAFEAAGDELLAALHDGTIKHSTDGGRSWAVRSRPQPTSTE